MTVVSIVVPLFNKGKFIEATLDSARKQTVCEIEILVIDNGSTDEGPEVVERFSRTDRRITLLRSPVKGPGFARNFGVGRAKGNWIQFLDADDLLAEDHLANLLEVAKANPEASVIVGGWREFVDGNPSVFKSMSPAGRDGTSLTDHAIASSPWAVHAPILRSELAKLVPWPTALDSKLCEDNAFWFSICLKGKVAYSESQGAIYRTQTENCRTQIRDISKWFTGTHAAILHNLDLLQRVGTSLTSGQCLSLVHMYSSLYREAKSQGSSEFSKLALEEARTWLNRYFSCEPRPRTSMLVRRLLGITTYETLKATLRR